MSDDYVRVTDTTTGHEISVRQSVVDSAGPEVLKPVKNGKEPADATDGNGDPLPPKFAESKSDGAKTAGTTSKEN